MPHPDPTPEREGVSQKKRRQMTSEIIQATDGAKVAARLYAPDSPARGSVVSRMLIESITRASGSSRWDTAALVQ